VTDFFGARGRKEVEREMKKLERRTQQAPAARAATRLSELRGRTWVTRRDPHVDRLASAWLVRRFVDARARFRFVDPKSARLGSRELGFDMPGGAFTHEGGRCTFEVLLARLQLRDPALVPIAEIVHDIDLKDERFGRAETDGVPLVAARPVSHHAERRGPPGARHRALRRPVPIVPGRRVGVSATLVVTRSQVARLLTLDAVHRRDRAACCSRTRAGARCPRSCSASTRPRAAAST
jgi:hypothetical protein